MYKIMWKPKYFQVMTMNTDIMTDDGSANQSRGSMPNQPRM